MNAKALPVQVASAAGVSAQSIPNGWISVADAVPHRFKLNNSSLPVLGLVNTGNCFSDLTRALVVYHPAARPFWKLAPFDDMPLAKNLRGKVEVIAWAELPAFPDNSLELRRKAKAIGSAS